MTREYCDRKVVPIWIRPSRVVLAALVYVAAAASGRAQQGPVYYPGSPPAVQQAQNRYYGNYQENRVPGYIYPRPMPMPANYGFSDNGITYHYVNNPTGQTYPPFPSPNGTPPAYQARHRTPTYPAPVNTPAVQLPHAPISEDLGDGRKPTVAFHRPTNEKAWVKGEYLAAFLRPMRLGSGPLATTGSPFDGSPGALGLPATSVLFGDPVNFGLYSGVKLEAGVFLDCDNRYSLDVIGFYLFPNTESFTTTGDANGNPVISRPIFDVVRGAERVFLNSDPGNITGTLSIQTKSQMLGLELNARYHGYIRERVHANALLGFRYLRLDERLQIQESITNITPNFLTFQGNRVTGADFLLDDDNFRNVNQFFGPQIGGQVSWEYKCFILDAFAKLAIGPTVQKTDINGSTTLVSPNGNQVVNGGILALPSNSGSHQRTVLGLVPELGFNLGIDLTQHVRVSLGYSFLMWNHVARPGSQYDRNVNPTQIPGSPTFANLQGPSSPAYRFTDEFFWSHTLNFALEFHY